VGKLIEERDYIDALRQYAKARIGFVGATGADYVGYAANDEVDRMHTAWLKLRNFLASKHNTSFLKWCPAEAKAHPPNFSQFIEHCRRVKRQKATKKMIDTYCDKPSFLGGPEK
jgi:hypothetical protein